MEETSLWTKDIEVDFFKKSLEVASPEKLFYTTEDNKYYAYWPKNYKGKKTTLQSRNAFIGAYTEKWAQELLKDTAKELDAFVVRSIICDEIELSNKSPGDIAICRKDSRVQKAEDILALFEVKMSIVWNWEYHEDDPNEPFVCLGDYKTHQGNPGMLRSDSMLKAIGKSISVRIASLSSAGIPIIILGNTPVTQSYYAKVDNLKKYGIIQGFWSLNPSPLDNNGENIKHTPDNGFIRFDSFMELHESILSLLKEERTFFAGMKTRKELGEIIAIANREESYEKKAERFLTLMRR